MCSELVFPGYNLNAFEIRRRSNWLNTIYISFYCAKSLWCSLKIGTAWLLHALTSDTNTRREGKLQQKTNDRCCIHKCNLAKNTRRQVRKMATNFTEWCVCMYTPLIVIILYQQIRFTQFYQFLLKKKSKFTLSEKNINANGNSEKIDNACLFVWNILNPETLKSICHIWPFQQSY